ncbi:MAG: disulfide bond formation protein DsbA [Actinomycetales bacterium]|nr:disulfide bond formation protein DsbA [Actinomycetales bacterium]
MAGMDSIDVDFWLDPLCPWSWLTAEWLLEVERQGAVEVTWHVMSLSVLNEDADLPPEWREFNEKAWGPVRVLEMARQQAGEAAFVPLMRAICRRWHVDERRDVSEILAEAVAECDLPESIAQVAWTDDVDEDVRLSHKRAMALGGPDVGSPILGFVRDDGEQVGFYGPIISRVPRGEDAVRLFEATRTLAVTPGFFELKRTRDEEPWLE